MPHICPVLADVGFHKPRPLSVKGVKRGHLYALSQEFESYSSLVLHAPPAPARRGGAVGLQWGSSANGAKENNTWPRGPGSHLLETSKSHACRLQERTKRVPGLLFHMIISKPIWLQFRPCITV